MLCPDGKEGPLLSLETVHNRKNGKLAVQQKVPDPYMQGTALGEEDMKQAQRVSTSEELILSKGK